jgi:phosphopantetheinyl transferase
LEVIYIKTYIERINFHTNNVDYEVSICYCFVISFSHYENLIKFLHKKETGYYDNLKHEKRKKSYLIGRYSAKRAISVLTNVDDLQEILIQPGVFNQPIISYKRSIDAQVSITHSGDFGAAVAFPEALPMGIDIEKIDPGKKDVMESQITNREKSLIKGMSGPDEKMLTLLWSAKESLSKVLKTGLTIPFDIYEIESIKHTQNCFIAFFKNFTQYKTLSFTLGQYMCSIAYPRLFNLNLDTKSLKYLFDLTGDA